MKPTCSLDWSRISSDEALHELINALFCAELGPLEYIPGDPTGGRDRGWDGMIRYGRLPFVDRCPRGKWMIQSKFTRAEGKEAARRLRTALVGTGKKRGEIDKAVAAGATHLALFTQATMAPDLVESLEALSQGSKLRRLVVFTRKRLEPLIGGNRRLRVKFFGEPGVVALKPAWEIEAQAESWPVAELPFVGRREEIDDIRKNVLDGRRVILLAGKGGTGKSRLIRETALRAGQDLPGHQILLYRPGVRDAKDVLQDELEPGRNYVIFVDDADREFSSIIPLALAFDRKDILGTLVLVCRQGPDALVGQWLKRNGVTPARVALEPLGETEQMKLLADNTSLNEIQRRQVLLHTGGNLLLLAFAIGAMRSGNHPLGFSSAPSFREFLVNRVISQAEESLSAERIELPPALLPTIAALVPLGVGQPAIDVEVGKFLGIAETEFRGIVDALVHGTVLRRVGHSIRFDNDVVGDMVLEYHVSRPANGGFVQALWDALSRSLEDNLIANFTAASHLGSHRTGSFLEGLAQSWQRGIPKTALYERRSLLRKFEAIAHVIPSRALCAVQDALRLPLRPPVEESLFWPRNKPKPANMTQINTDDVGPILVRILAQGEHLSGLMDVLAMVAEKAPEGTYHNYRPGAVLSEGLNPYFVGKGTVGTILGKIDEWFRSPRLAVGQLSLSSAVVKTLLACNVSFTESEGARLHLHSASHPATPAWFDVRERAMGLLRSGLEHPLPSVRKTAVSWVMEIGGDPGMARVSDELDRRMASERQQAIEWLAARVAVEADPGVLVAIDQVACKLWMMQWPGTDGASRVLEVVSRSLRHRVISWTTDSHATIDDFEAIRTVAPESERWSWWVSRTMRGWRSDPPEMQHLADEILEQYPDGPALAAFLRELGTFLPGKLSSAPAWLVCLAKAKPHLISELATTADAALFVGDVFAPVIEVCWMATDSAAWSRILAGLPADLSTASAVDCVRLLGALVRAEPAPTASEVTDVLRRLAAHPASDVRASVVDACQWRVKLPSEDVAEVIGVCLRVDSDPAVLDVVADTVASFSAAKTDAAPIRAAVRDVMSAALLTSDPDSLNKEFAQLLLWGLDGDRDSLLSLLERCAEQSRSLRAIHMLAAAWFIRPLAALSDFFGDGEGFSELVRKLMNWSDRGLVTEGQATYCLGVIADRCPAGAIQFVGGGASACGPAHLVRGVLRKVPFTMAQSAWLSLLGEVAGTPEWELTTQAFLGAACFIGEIRGTVGEPPPAYLTRIGLLEDLQRDNSDVPGMGVLFDEAIQYVQEQLSNWMESHEERIAQR